MKHLPCALFGLIVVGMICDLTADDFYWKGGNPWGQFGDSSCWAVGQSAGAGNPKQLIPSENDWLYLGDDWGKSFYIRLAATDQHSSNVYSIKGLSGIALQWGLNEMHLGDGNAENGGTLVITESFSNMYVQPDIQNGVKLVLDETSSSQLGNSDARSLFTVRAGGELDVLGAVQILNVKFDVETGGKLIWGSGVVAFDRNASDASVHQQGKGIVNTGTLELAEGFDLQPPSNPAQVYLENPPNFLIRQVDGELKLGGNVTTSIPPGPGNGTFAVEICGGRINVIADAAIRGLASATVPENSAVEIVLAEGKTFDASELKFGTQTSLFVSGAGTLVLGQSVPSDLTLAPDVNLCLTKSVEFKNVSGCETARLSVRPTGREALMFKTSDPTLLSVLANIVAPDGWTKELLSHAVLIRTIDTQTFYWRRAPSNGYYAFSDPENWVMGAHASGPVATACPGGNDWLHYTEGYETYQNFDLCGGYSAVRGVDFTEAVFEYGFRNLRIKNGTLEFLENFLNQRVIAQIDNGGHFILGENCTARFGWGGAQNEYTIASGGEFDMEGTLQIGCLRVFNQVGGRVVCAPRSIQMVNDGATSMYSGFDNSGIMNFPQGLAYEAGADYQSGNACTNDFVQRAGVMTLGGDMTRGVGLVNVFNFDLVGGELKITDDVTMPLFDRIGMLTVGSVATIDVGDGKHLDWANATFAEGTTLIKTGSGTLELSGGAPAVLQVENGQLRLKGSTMVSCLQLSESSTLEIAAPNLVLENVSGYANAQFVIDPVAVRQHAAGRILLTSDDPALLQTIKARALVPGSYNLVVKGNQLLLQPNSGIYMIVL